MSTDKIAVGLDGVPETLLWPLYGRAAEARRRDGVLRDARAVAVADRVDYPFEERFGRPSAAFALRARCFDKYVEDFLARHPEGTVVSLGEGLETQFWRVDNGTARWLTVDLPETIEVRRKLLPDGQRRRSLACSALDLRWMDEVATENGVCVVAQGLFMYFDRAEVDRLIGACADRFPGATLIFDTMPAWLTGGSWLRTLMMRGNRTRGDGEYRLPEMAWGTRFGELERLRALHPRIAAARDIGFPPGRGLVFGYLNPFLGALPVVREFRPRNFLLTIAPEPDAQRT
ncbi:class I SAM-dependent methyltransferase [Nocardia puris]|uniref:O-methyltransferase involved in polyketide biosynthesis n=1 Tax=Nocardia puris TaxID=208602 RepID=A0A366DCP4_9NOCA|nr:class I SAM-dependent methyltransferase [Nocardia puris]RBO87813.1 O-methyltransferase involved in polyketide biosynthesis [Nocardia puris]